MELYIESIIRRDDIEKIKSVLRDPRLLPSDLNNAISYASQNGHTEIVRLLLDDKRVDPSEYNNKAIRSASHYGHTKIVRLLLTDGRVDSSAKDNEAIRLASRYGNFEIVRLLLTDGRVDPSADNNYAIYWAYRQMRYGIVKLLITSPKLKPFQTSFKMKNIFDDEEGTIVEVLNDLIHSNPQIASTEGYLLYLMLAGPILQNTTLKQWIHWRCEELNIVLVKNEKN